MYIGLNYPLGSKKFDSQTLTPGNCEAKKSSIIDYLALRQIKLLKIIINNLNNNNNNACQMPHIVESSYIC